jgi:TolB-like protein
LLGNFCVISCMKRFSIILLLFFTYCAMPPTPSVLEQRCPELFSTVAQFYKNRDWENVIKNYKEIIDLGCHHNIYDEVYIYYAIAYEYLGQYNSSEMVLLEGLSYLPNNIDLRKRLAFAYDKQGKTVLLMDELDRLAYLAPEDVDIKIKLAELYMEQKMYCDEAAVLKDILKLQPNNEEAKRKLARASILCGRGPNIVINTETPTNTIIDLKTIAVIEFSAKGVSVFEASALTDELEVQIVSLSKSITVIERGKMEEIVKEQGFQQSGCVTSECAVQVGELLGADNVVIGSIIKLGSTYSVTAKIVSIETGSIINTATIKHRGAIDYLLTNSMKEIAINLLTK